jgi:hypothetical protein
MKFLFAVVLIVMVGCTSLEKQQSNEQAQINMVKVQREAREREEKVEAQEKAALYEAIAKIAATNPEHSPAALVALTAISMQADDEDGESEMPMVGLRDKPNEALLWTQALAPTVGSLVNGLGVAMVGASVAKNNSDNNARVQIADGETNAAIVGSIADLGVAAVGAGGVDVGGDYLYVQDSGVIDQSSNTTDSYNTISTSDSSSNVAYTASDNAFINAGIADYTDYIIDYEGSNMSLAELIAALDAAGAAYSIDLDGTTVATSEGDGDSDPVSISCDSPQFSPAPPECS